MRFLARPLALPAAILALAALLAMALMAPQARAQGVFNPEVATLDNGMRIVVVTNRLAPVINHMVWYNIGAADDPQGLSGVAHYLEHMMFRGTKDLADGEFDQIISQNGGTHNAFTGYDYTAYFATIAADRLELMMELEAERMANLVIDNATAATEQSVVREERRQTTEQNPSRRLGEQMFAALFQNHPYGRPIIGWGHEIPAMTPAVLNQAYETYYAPNNAILVISGDVTMAEVLPVAQRTFGEIGSRPVPERLRPREPETSSPRRVVLADPLVRQPEWERQYLGPDPDSFADGGAAADVAAEILSGRSGPFYQDLVVERQLATSAGAYLMTSLRDYSVFGVFANPRPGVDMATLEAAVDSLIARVLADGVAEDEVARAKERLKIETIYARDSIGFATRVFGFALTTGASIEAVESWPDRIDAVTAQDVAAVLATYLNRDRSVTGILTTATGPETQ